MKKIALYYECPLCEKKFRFDKTDLPAGFVSPNDLNKNRISLLEVECPECNQSDVFTLEQIKKALESPDPLKGKWKWFWKE